MTLRMLSNAALPIGALLASALLLGGCGDAPSGGTPAAPKEPAATVAAPAAEPAGKTPGLAVDTLDHGRFDLAERRGEWVVVNFWATWCAPCLKEIPDLSAFHEAREDVTVIGLAYEEIAPDDMRAFLKKVPASYPIAILDVYDPPADFETPRGLPMTYLVAPDGTIARQFLGPVTSEELAKAIEAHGLRS